MGQKNNGVIKISKREEIFLGQCFNAVADFLTHSGKNLLHPDTQKALIKGAMDLYKTGMEMKFITLPELVESEQPR